MLQKNISGAPIILPTLDPPVTVPPGETFDYDEPLAGFELVDKQDKEPDKKTTDKPAANTARGDKE